MKKNIILVFICLIIGLYLSKIMFDGYNTKETVKASLNQEKITLIQVGIFKNKQQMHEKLDNINDYIYEKKDKKYYVYAGITQNNLQKLKMHFKKQNFDVYPKQINCNNLEFLNELNNYDLLLKKTNDNNAISDIEDQIIHKYKELIIDVKGNTTK